jgi:hypothetical protein
MDERTQRLIEECRRQQESGLYTSTTLFEWLKELRWWRVVFVVLPIILGGVATWPLLEKQADMQWLTAVCALLAGVMPAVYKALDLDVSLVTLAKHAGEFKILQDRFRQAWTVTALGDFDAFKAEFDTLMLRLDAARVVSLTPPERFFNRAQKKIGSGDYDFSVDTANNGGQKD